MSKEFTIGSKKLLFTHTAVNKNAHLFIDNDHDPKLCPECIQPGVLKFDSTNIPVTDMSKESIDIHYANMLLSNSINHATQVIEYASTIISAGPAGNKHELKKRVEQFTKIHKAFAERETNILDKFRKDATDGR